MRMHGCGHHGRHGKGAMIAMVMGGWGRHRGGRGWGDGFGSGDWGGGERAPRGRSRMFGSGELRLVLLGLIAQTPRHGYELIKAIDELSGGQYAPSPGVVYPTLSLLTDEAVVEELAGEGSRKSFAVTAAGRAELAERQAEFDAIVARIKGLAAAGERHSAPPLKRAMGNLHTAVSGRMAAGEVDRETIHQIAELLDEAARKIERL